MHDFTKTFDPASVYDQTAYSQALARNRAKAQEKPTRYLTVEHVKRLVKRFAKAQRLNVLASIAMETAYNLDQDQAIALEHANKAMMYERWAKMYEKALNQAYKMAYIQIIESAR